MNEVEKFIGYKFKNKKLLSQSLTHKSVNPQIKKSKTQTKQFPNIKKIKIIGAKNILATVIKFIKLVIFEFI